MTRKTSSLALALFLCITAGCGGGASICDSICDCTGDCSDNDRDECYDEFDDAERRADNEECGGEFDDYVSCLNSEFECRDGGRYDVDGCGFENEELNDCYRGRGRNDGVDL